MDDLKKKVEELEKKIQKLETKRIYQMDVTPGAIKNRHLGEANTYILAGLEADRPTGHEVTSSTVAYFAKDTNVLSIWNGTAWVSETLT